MYTFYHIRDLILDLFYDSFKFSILLIIQEFY